MAAPRRQVALLAVLLLAALSATSAEAGEVRGRVVDGAGDPVVGARVCYFQFGVEQLCAETDSDGRYDLFESKLDTLRIVKAGFLPRDVPAKALSKDVVLDAAATLFVRLEDKTTGDPIEAGQVVLSWPSGRVHGPFPSNAVGVRVRSLRPGPVKMWGEAEGFEKAMAEADLQPGEEATVVIRLEPSGAGVSRPDPAPESP